MVASSAALPQLCVLHARAKFHENLVSSVGRIDLGGPGWPADREFKTSTKQEFQLFGYRLIICITAAQYGKNVLPPGYQQHTYRKRTASAAVNQLI